MTTLPPPSARLRISAGDILDARGEPLRNALVEIWQVDGHGAYLHSRSGNRDARDANFQGFGRFLTGSTGEYYFRTIKPIAYPGRTPHIHFAVKNKGQDKFTTQCYIKGCAGNERDGVYRSIRDPAGARFGDDRFRADPEFKDWRAGRPLRHRNGLHPGRPGVAVPEITPGGHPRRQLSLLRHGPRSVTWATHRRVLIDGATRSGFWPAIPIPSFMLQAVAQVRASQAVRRARPAGHRVKVRGLGPGRSLRNIWAFACRLDGKLDGL